MISWGRAEWAILAVKPRISRNRIALQALGRRSMKSECAMHHVLLHVFEVSYTGSELDDVHSVDVIAATGSTLCGVP